MARSKGSGPTPGSWKKGQSGNPNGAPPKEWTWAGTVRRVAEEEVDGTQIKEGVAKVLAREALKGNIRAIEEFGNRLDGRPPQGVELTGKDGQPLDYRVVVESVSCPKK